MGQERSQSGGAGPCPFDPAPRIAILTAFAPEWHAIARHLDNGRAGAINGIPLLTGTIAGRAMVLMQSGMSMVNAAMNAQALIDRFHLERILFSGIAGGVDSALRVGDMVIPQAWGQNLEVAYAREVPGGHAPPVGLPGGTDLPGHGALFPRDVVIGRAGAPLAARRWFPADPQLLRLARELAPDVPLERCIAGGGGEEQRCLDHHPRLMVGGHGVSGSAFVDNAAYRDYLARVHAAVIVDMESAAVAQVAWANRIPFLAIRSVSDLAGGDAGPNEMLAFMDLAAANSATIVRAFMAALPASGG